MIDDAPAALGVLAAAGLSDVLDGWAARRFGQVTPTGAVLDGVTDKLFALTVAVSLFVTGHLSALALVCLNVREIGEAPLVAWIALSRRARRARAERPDANVAGKVTTALQFGAVCSSLLHFAHTWAWAGATAVAGAFAAVAYWRRALGSYVPGDCGEKPGA